MEWSRARLRAVDVRPSCRWAQHSRRRLFRVMQCNLKAQISRHAKLEVKDRTRQEVVREMGGCEGGSRDRGKENG
jgi:hypothetical protein